MAVMLRKLPAAVESIGTVLSVAGIDFRLRPDFFAVRFFVAIGNIPWSGPRPRLQLDPDASLPG
jgi:hypothetical protein